MKLFFRSTLLLLFVLVLCYGCNSNQTTYIVYSKTTKQQIRNTSIEELISYFSHLSGSNVLLSDNEQKANILLYTKEQLPLAFKEIKIPDIPEEFTIETVNYKGKNRIIICGFDERAILYGVYELIEIYMAEINQSPYVDISFDFEKGSGSSIDLTTKEIRMTKVPFYKNRGIHLDFISLGTGAMLDSDNSQPKDKEIWQRWSKWSARHRLNFMTNWPYGKTNWWELVPDSVLNGATSFSSVDLEKAITIRKEMLNYSNKYAVDPYLMNYVPGKGSKDMLEKFPTLFTFNHEKNVPRFCYAQPQLWEIFNNVIESVTEVYPQMAGFNLRRWGESYPCECDFCMGRDTELSRQLLLEMIDKSKKKRDDIKIILSGYAEPEYAAHFPDYVTCLIKWGNDWDPSPDPGRSKEYLLSYGNKDVIIDNALPAEEAFPLGLIQHTQLNDGIKKYALNRADYPNLTGFAAGLGDSDIEFITELNYIIFAKLIREPELFDLDEFVNAYLINKFGEPAAKNIQLSLDIQADVWYKFFCEKKRGGYEFANLAPYSNWARFGDLFVSFPHGGKNAFDWMQSLSNEQLQKSLLQITELLDKQEEAYNLVFSIKELIPEKGMPMFNDFMLQTNGYYSYLQSRKSLIEAFLSKRAGNNQDSQLRAKMTISFNNQLMQVLENKPNNVGYGDQGGNIADWELSRTIEGIKIENNFLENSMLKSFDVNKQK